MIGALLIALAAGAPGPATPIVTADWLGDAASRGAQVSLVDVRDTYAYRAGHLRGAANAESSEFLATVNGVPGMMPTPEALTALARRLGVRADRPVVFYGDAEEPFAARSALEFRLSGHASAFWLDGGFQAAATAKLPIESGAAEIAPGDFVARPPGPGLVDAAWVEAHLRDGSVVFVDTRTPEEFARGHLPGAHRVDWTENLDAGRLRSERELWAAYSACRLAPDDRAKKTVVCYCTIGTRASTNVLALERLGFEHVLLYGGSWADWSRGNRPIETSAASAGRR